MLVTVTPRVRVHRDEVLCALVKGNTLVLRFASMKPMRVPIDEMTDEARRWLLPALAPREIPLDGCGCDDEEEGDDSEESDRRGDGIERTRGAH